MRIKTLFSVSVMVFMGAALWTQSASACGGFFCNNSSPVDQSGERILFSVEGTTVTAHIQIQYQGPAESFSWVLPLPSVPDVTVGTDMVFTRLRAMTDPRFELEWQKSESCKPDNECWDYMDGGSADSGGTTGSSDGGPEPTVNVLSEGDAGPYNYKVLEADTGQVLYN
ncbi:MAG TPA: DUF2330 domain-containing protein [Myxococcales bacterium]|nr:DUF2330 domain-containing protein [Myxococcales bacterium]